MRDPVPDELPVIDAFDALVDLVVAHELVFVRYSDGPAKDGERSTDYEAGVELPGLAVTNLTPEPWWPRPWADWIARRMCKYADLGDEQSGRRPWALVGRVVGNGPDHEPLVTDVRGLCWIGPQALRRPNVTTTSISTSAALRLRRSRIVHGPDHRLVRKNWVSLAMAGATYCSLS